MVCEARVVLIVLFFVSHFYYSFICFYMSNVFICVYRISTSPVPKTHCIFCDYAHDDSVLVEQIDFRQVEINFSNFPNIL